MVLAALPYVRHPVHKLGALEGTAFRVVAGRRPRLEPLPKKNRPDPERLEYGAVKDPLIEGCNLVLLPPLAKAQKNGEKNTYPRTTILMKVKLNTIVRLES